MANIKLALDGLRNVASTDYQTRIPEAVRTSITDVGNALAAYEPAQNEFLNLLINKIGLTLVESKIATNKLAVFKRQTLEFGDTVEEIFVKMAEGFKYDPASAETNVFKRELPEVDTLFHRVNKEMVWKVTVQRNWLKRAFHSEGAFSRFVSGIVQSIYSARTFDEYVNMKELFSEAVTNGQAVVVDGLTIPTDDATAKGFVKAVKRVSKNMTYMSDDYNHKKVMTFTPTSDQVLLLHKDISIDVSTELLASAFNKGEFDYNTQVIEVDSFGTNENIIAALVDREWFMVLDTLQETGSIYNPEGLYWNYWVHHHQLLSYSLFKNAVFFYQGTYTA